MNAFIDKLIQSPKRRDAMSSDHATSIYGVEGQKELDDELTRIDPSISAEELFAGFCSNRVSARAFGELAGSRLVDAHWLKGELSAAVDGRDWCSLSMLLSFVPNVDDPDIDLILGKALRLSFDQVLTANHQSAWGTPEMIVDALSKADSAKNNPRVVPDLVYVCKLPPDVPQEWYLDYRKAIDAIRRTTAMPKAARIEVLRTLLDCEVDYYVQEAIDLLLKESTP